MVKSGLLVFIFMACFILLSSNAGAEEWTLSFVERDTMPWARGSSVKDNDAAIYVYVNNDLAKSYPTIGQDYHYGLETVNLSSYDPEGGKITLAFKGYRTGFLLYNINISRDGEMVDFAPWTVSGFTTDEQIHYDNTLRDDRIMAYIGNDGWVNFTTSTISIAPELVIKPSGLHFSKPMYDISNGDGLQITAEVENTGSADESDAAVKLYVNDALYQTSSGSPVPKGSSANFTFTYTADFGGGHLIKVEAEVVPSGSEGMTHNNKAVKYILDHPYFYVTDFSEAPVNTHSGQEPYSSWDSSLQSDAGLALSYDYASSTAAEHIKAEYALRLSLYGNIHDDSEYQNKAMEALSYIGDGDWNWANRSNAGNTAEGAGGTHTVYPANADYSGSVEDSGANWGDVLVGYGIAYELNFDYIKSYDETHGTSFLPAIRDKLARLCQDAYLLAKEIYNYHGGGDRTTAFNFGDWGTGKLAMEGGIGVCTMALLDYDGQYQDIESMDEIVEFVERDLFEEGSKLVGAPESLLQIQVNEDGIWEEGSGYQDYHAPTTSYFMALYKSTFGVNLADVYPLAYGYGTFILRTLYPTGQYPQIATSYGSPWYPQINYYLMFDKDEEEYKAGTWFVNYSIIQQRGYRGNDNGQGAGGDMKGYSYLLLGYDKSAAHSHFSDGTYFFPENTAAVLRSGFGKEDLYVFFTAPDNHTMSGHSSDTISQLVFDMWAKGAYLVARRGDERFLDQADYIGRAGFTTMLVKCPTCSWGGQWKAIYRGAKGTYGDMDNPSQITSTLNSGSLDYAEGGMTVSDFVNMTGSASYTAALPFTFDWTRGIMMVAGEYVVVSDRLVSDSSRDYAMVIPFGETNGNVGGSGDADNYAWGNLMIDGTDTSWYDRTQGSEAFVPSTHSSAQEIVWKTRSETNDMDTTSEAVNLTVRLNPASDTDIVSGTIHFGNYGVGYEWYIPVANVKQSGADVKYLTVYYPTNSTDTRPAITNVQITGGSGGNDYATRLTRGAVTDIMSVSDGETISADVMTTNAELAFSRAVSGGLQYFFMRSGTAFSYSGSDRLSVSSVVPELVLVSYEDGNSNITMRVKGSGTAIITLKNLDPSSAYAVKRDGAAYTNWVLKNSNKDIAITTALSEHVFEIYATGESGDGGNETDDDNVTDDDIVDVDVPEEPGPQPETCEESWECGSWSVCVSAIKTRACTDANNCGTELDKPVEQEPCCDKLDISIFPKNLNIRKGESGSFIITVETSCDPNSVEMELDGIDSSWYSIEKRPGATPGILDFNVSLNIPPQAGSGNMQINLRPVSSDFSGKVHKTKLNIIYAEDEEQVRGEQIPSPSTDTFLYIGIAILIIIIAIIIYVLRNDM